MFDICLISDHLEMAEIMSLDDILEEINSDSNVEDSTNSPLNSRGVDNGENNINSDQVGTDSHLRTPLASQFNPRIAKFLSTSSLKKKQTKLVDCKYCVKFCFNRCQLEEHLQQSECCISLYKREMKVNCLNGILVKSYKCMACASRGGFQLKRHLQNHAVCLNFYLEKFQVKDWAELKPKLINLTRCSYKSRTSLKRRLENAALAAKKKDVKTVVESINMYRKDISVANYRLCINCGQNFLSSGALQISATDTRYEDLELNKKHLRRMGTFWICTLCESSNKELHFSMAAPVFQEIEIEGKKILYPTNTTQHEEIEIDCWSLILIPNKYSSSFKTNTYSIPLYKNERVSNELISSMYNNRAAKFALRNMYADIYSAEISNLQNKKLQSVSMIYDDSMIRSSVTWMRKKSNSIFAQFKQFGPAAIAYSMDVDLNNLETKITSKLCEGRVVTIEFIGSCQDEFETKYYEHNHNNSTSCTASCIKTELNGIGDNIKTEDLPIFISSLSQRQASFITNFMKNKNFELFAEEYNSNIDFYLSGSARINGISWTTECESFNAALSISYFNGTQPEFNNYLHYVESSILTTINQTDIKLILGCTEEEAVKIRNLGVLYQVNLQMDDKHVPLPSLEIMMRMKPKDDVLMNIMSSKRLLEILKQILIALSTEEKNCLTTEDWLENLNKKAKFDSKSERQMSLNFDGTILEFGIEERLDNLMRQYGCFIGICI